jgi:hypothetical protein
MITDSLGALSFDDLLGTAAELGIDQLGACCRQLVAGAPFGARPTSPISLRVSSPSPPHGTEGQRSVCIPAWALAAGSSEHSYSASRSINSAGRRSSPPGH